MDECLESNFRSWAKLEPTNTNNNNNRSWAKLEPTNTNNNNNNLYIIGCVIYNPTVAYIN